MDDVKPVHAPSASATTTGPDGILARWAVSRPKLYAVYLGCLFAILFGSFGFVFGTLFASGQGIVGDAIVDMVLFFVIFLSIGGAYAFGMVLPFVHAYAEASVAAVTPENGSAVGATKRSLPSLSMSAGDTQSAAPELPKSHVDLGHQVPGAVEIYQSTLMHIWEDGIVTEKEARTLDDLRGRLGVTEAQHQHMEDEVKDVLFGGEPPASPT